MDKLNRTDAEWRALCAAIDKAGWAADARFADQRGRHEAHGVDEEGQGEPAPGGHPEREPSDDHRADERAHRGAFR